MPTIFVNGPPTKSIAQRREVVEGITRVIEEAYGIPGKEITVVIREDAPDHVSTGGVLLSDQKK